MTSQDIVPGDRVVDLAASLKFAALVSGGITGALSLWIIKHSAPWSIAAFVIGAGAGLCIGLVLGPVIYPAAAGNVAVVAVGPDSLAATLKAGLLGAVIAGAIAAAVPAALFAPSAKLVQFIGFGCGIGAVIGGVLGYLASR